MGVRKLVCQHVKTPDVFPCVLTVSYATEGLIKKLRSAFCIMVGVLTHPMVHNIIFVVNAVIIIIITVIIIKSTDLSNTPRHMILLL